MKLSRFLLLAVACASVVSCGDDPIGPSGGTYIPPAYDTSLESMNVWFRRVCGSGAGDVYVTGSAILHHDGTKWRPISPPPYVEHDIRIAECLPSGELIISDGVDVYVHRNESWTLLPKPPHEIDEVEALSLDDLYAYTWGGLAHFDGHTWTDLPVYEPWELNDLTVSTAGATMVGHYGRICRFDGGDWSNEYVDSTRAYRSVALTPSGRTFVSDFGLIWEIIDSTPVLIPPGDDIREPKICTDGETLFMAGYLRDFETFVIKRYESGSWTEIDRGKGTVRDFWVGNGDLAAAGDNAFIWRGNAAGGAQVSPYPNRGPFSDAVSVDDAIYTIGTASYRYRNGTWTNLDKEYITPRAAIGIHGLTQDNIYAVGDEMILHYDGAAWSWVNAGLVTRLTAVSVQPNGGVVAVGSAGDYPAIVELVGDTWSKRSVPGNSRGFNDVCTVGGTVVAVGDHGFIAMRRDDHWTLVQPTNADLVSVWGSDEHHIYAASLEPNEICFFDGFKWEPMIIEGPLLTEIRSVWGTSPSDIFALDYYGTFAHFDGKNWVALERLFTTGMRTVCGVGHEVITVGSNGAVIYRR